MLGSGAGGAFSPAGTPTGATRSHSGEWQAASTSTFIRSSRLLAAGPKPHKCAICCTLFSVIAVAFLIWVGVYVGKDSEYVELTIPADEAATQVFVAAGLYGLTGVIAAGFWVKALWKARNAGAQHELLDMAPRD